MKRVSLAVVLMVLAVIFTSLSGMANAQDKAVRYKGDLFGGSGGCPLNGQAMQVDVSGGDLKGFFVSSRGGPARFEGITDGKSFRVIYSAKNGDKYTIDGTFAGEKIDIKLTTAKCSFRAALAKV